MDTPSIKEINDNIVAQLEYDFGKFLPRSFSRVISKVLAGVFIILYKYCGFNALQMFVSTATYNATTINGKVIRPLVEWGRLFGVGDLNPATNAELLISFNVDSTGGILPVGSQLVADSTNVVYLTTQTVDLNTTTKQISIIAVSDPDGNGGAGTIGNLLAGQTLSFANPLAGVARKALVVSTIVTGANAETAEEYRRRVTRFLQQRPQGGAYADYRDWGESVSGVLNVYPYTSENPGQVDVYVESSTTTDGIPTLAQLQEVRDAIDLNFENLATRRPANALVNTFPINRRSFSVEVQGLSVANISVVRARIQAALTGYFLAKEPYIVGLTVPPRLDRITQSAVSGVVDDVVSAADGEFSDIVLKLDGQVTIRYTLGIGEKAKLGDLIYT